MPPIKKTSPPPRRSKGAAERGRRGGTSKVIRMMREDILARNEGAFLGSEEDLLARYQISRQTLRQAARVLENEQLLRVRRGVGGGYYVRQPTIEAVGRVAATYLRIRQVTLDDQVEVAHLINETLFRKAAVSQNATLRKQLAELIDGMDDETLPENPVDFFLWDVKTTILVAELSGNAALELITSILGQVGLEESRPTLYTNRPARMAAWLKTRRRLMGAILDQDPEVAALHGARCHELVKGWLAEDRKLRIVRARRDRSG